MYRQLYQLGGGITQLSNGQEEPIFPRLETLSQNLGQAEQTLGAPSNQFDVSSITTAFTGRPPMNRGGIASLVDREKYGLGSKIKKFVRNIIPNEVAQIATVAAPFVAPFNPLLAGAMAGLGSFDQTGRIGSSLKSAALTYGGGQLARYVGGAGLQGGFNPFDATGLGGSMASSFIGIPYSSPIGMQTGLQLGQYELFGGAPKTPIGIDDLSQVGVNVTGAGGPTGFGADLKTIFSPDSNVGLETRARAAMSLTGDAIKAMYTNKDGTLDKKMIISTLVAIPSFLEARKKADQIGLSANEFNEQIYNQEKMMFQTAYQSRLPMEAFGIRPQSAKGGLMDDTGGILSIKLTPAMAMGGRIDYETGGPTTTAPVKTLPMDLESLARRLFDTNLDNLSPSEKQYLYEFKEQNKAKKAKGGMMGSEIPLRQNEGGITELDLRAKGGYIPVGIKEKADDVPAMLSRNEFVFTADAVRGAGNGNINKGAQKMYKLMKSLEKKVKKMKKVI